MAGYMADLRRLAATYGYVLHRTGKHHIWRHPASGSTVVTPRTSRNSGRGMQNIEAQMRRALG